MFPMVYSTPKTSYWIRRNDQNEFSFLVMHVFRSFAAHRDKFTTKSVSEVMDMNFIKVKDFFVNHMPNNKNHLQFLHKCYYVGDVE